MKRSTSSQHAFFASLLCMVRNATRAKAQIVDIDTLEVVQKYLDGIVSEVEEVRDEVRENNSVRLEDELSDVLWDWCNAVVLCERQGLISDAEAVVRHAVEKYEQRMPAIVAQDDALWDRIKHQQKYDIARRHKYRYKRENSHNNE